MNNDLDFTLIAAPEEQPFDEKKQQQVRRIVQGWARALNEPPREYPKDPGRPDIGAEFLAAFLHTASLAAQKGFAPLVAVLGTWIKERSGRKVRIKVGDVEIEASSTEDVRDLLAQAQAFKQANEPKRIHEP